ncbi:MAG: hypothetical protein EOP84_21135 [Verrucomicrobiaceae bacterium]|nr:MAG: hypothetical protein EOP84_21135 [Verrucomicrobiaceae bacterium]
MSEGTRALFYSEALARYKALKKQAELHIGNTFARWGNNIERCILYSHRNTAIVAGDGWYPLNLSDIWGIEAHAGPGLNSHLQISKTPKYRYLIFEIIFVAGLHPHELLVIDAKRAKPLPIRVLYDGRKITVSIDLGACKSEAHVVIRSPRIFPLCRFDKNWSGTTRRVAYATGHWRLSATEAGTEEYPH